jgi:hypothetical protein
MSKSFGVPGESAREQAEARRQRIEQLERLERSEEAWEHGAAGEESTAAAIAKRCPGAVALHDRRLAGGRANIDHIVLVQSGVWVIDSKRPKGRIKVDNARDGTQRLLIDGTNRTELVHKLAAQVTAVQAVMHDLDRTVPVYGAFCFHIPADTTIERIRVEDNGLPLLRTWTVDGFPLFSPRQMCRRLNAAGTLSATGAEELGGLLAERFPPAARHKAAPQTVAPVSATPGAQRPDVAVPSATRGPQRRDIAVPRATPGVQRPAGSAEPRLSKAEFRARKEAEQLAAWEAQRPEIERALGGQVPPVLADQLRTDPLIWCHHSLWHSRVYLACVHGRVGERVPWRTAGAVVAELHNGRPLTPQWNALNGFLEHLRDTGYVEFSRVDGRITEVLILRDLVSP